MARLVAGLAALLLTAGTAAAGGPGDDGTHHPEGVYGGVNPGTAPSPDAKLQRPGPRTLGWVGFKVDDGAAVVFFQAAQPFQVSQRVEGGAVVVTLDGLAKLARNARRPLDTRYFDAPIDRVSAKAVKAVRGRKGKPGHGAGVEVRIAFRAGAAVSEGVVRTATEADGLFYAYLTFAAAAPAAAPDSGD